MKKSYYDMEQSIFFYKVLTVILFVSIFANIVQFYVLVGNESEFSQYNEAVQYLGNSCIETEGKIASGLCLERLW